MATEKISPLDKTSLRIDRKKIAEAQKLLGTSTIADTVDAALDEVIAAGGAAACAGARSASTEVSVLALEELRRLRDAVTQLLGRHKCAGCAWHV